MKSPRISSSSAKSFANDVAFIEIEQLTSKINDIELLDLYNLADYVIFFKNQK